MSAEDPPAPDPPTALNNSSEMVSELPAPSVQDPPAPLPSSSTPTLPHPQVPSQPAPSTSKTIGEASSSDGGVPTANGASPGQAAVQSDHCYGLPYQDHNYGGPPVPAGPLHVSSGRPPYPFKVRYPAGLRAMREGVAASSSEEGDAREAFPVIGGLERYLNDEAPEPDTSPAPAARTTLADGISVTSYRPRHPSTSNATHPHQYQRYIANADQQVNPTSGGYSQHLVQIGGRTYIRQTTGPNGGIGAGDVVGGGNVAVFRNRNDYIGTNNPPVLIPPYGGRGRGGPKRAGRPRLARNVAALPASTPISTLSSLSSPGLDPHAQTGPAPMIAPSKGGRPSGRGRGPRRRSNLSASSAAASGPLSTKNSPLLSPGSSAAEEEDKGFAVLLADYEKRYHEVFNRPLPSPLSAEQLPSQPGRTQVGAQPSPGQLPLPQPRHMSPQSSSNLLTASTLAKSRTAHPRQDFVGGCARTRGTGKATPLKLHASPPPPPSLSPATERLIASPLSKSTPSNLLQQLTCEGSSVAQVVEELREERLEAQRNAATARAQSQLSPHRQAAPTTPRSPVPPTFAPSPPTFNGTVPKEEEAGTSDVSTDTDSGAESSETETDSEGEWAGADYTTRCICGLEHNDEFMICCDQCDAWQHCRCMGIGNGKQPESYLCERCLPRILRISPDKAREFQLKKLERRAKEKERKKSAKVKRRQNRHKEKERRKMDKKRAKKARRAGIAKAKSLDTFTEIPANEYSDEARRFLNKMGGTLGAELLDRVAPSACAVMYVGPDKQGLVATQLIPAQHPAAEYRGRVLLGRESNGRDKLGRFLSFVLIYDDFPLSGLDNSAESVCVDARLRGSTSRFVRRSCRPNTQLKHVIADAQLHLLLVATEPIEKGTEVTVPFDWDFRSSRFPVECACVQAPVFPVTPIKGGSPAEPVCPVLEFNKDLEERRVQLEASKQKARAKSALAQPAASAKRPILHGKVAGKKGIIKKPKSLAAKKVAAAKAGGSRLQIRMAASKARKASKKGGRRAAGRAARERLRLRSNAASSSAEEARSEDDYDDEEEEGELKEELKSDPQSSPTASPRGRKKTPKTPQSPPVGVVDRSRPMDREERKMAEMIAMVQRLEEDERRKKERKERDSPRDVGKAKSPAKRGPVNRKRTSNSNSSFTKSPGKKSLLSPEKPDGRQLRSGRSRESESMMSSSAEAESFSSSDEDEGQSRPFAPPPVPSSLQTLRNAPPRKRWMSNQRGQELEGTPGPAVDDFGGGKKVTPPSGGTKKRWLRQAMSEDHSPAVPSPPSRPPPKKRRVEDDDFSTADAAALLTQMGQDAPASPPRIPIPPSPLAAQPFIPPLSAVMDDQPMIKKRKKVSLDEYKKRKSFVHSTDSTDSVPTPSPSISGPPTPACSFIPQMDRLADSGRSIKLTNLPDPQSIGKGTATFEDLKARIYGRKFLDSGVPVASEAPAPPPPPRSQPLASPPQSPPQAPPPPPPPTDAVRMSLADRLRTEFGLESEPDPLLTSPEHLAQQRPPPPPPHPAYRNLNAQMGETKLVNGKATADADYPEKARLEESGDEEEDGEIRDSPRASRRRRASPPRSRRAQY